MSSEDKVRGTAWRSRAIASAGVVAAVVVGGLAAATSAAAATPTLPTLTVAAPATLANDGTGSGEFSVEINNSATGNGVIGGTNGTGTDAATNVATLSYTFTVPTGLSCSNLSLVSNHSTPSTAPNPPPGTTPPAPVTFTGGTSGTCTATFGNYTQPANSDYTYYYVLAVQAVGSSNPTGTITSSAKLTEVTTTGQNVSTQTATSNTATTQLSAPVAPSFTATTPPNGVVFHPYSFTLVTNPGTPTTPTTSSASTFGTGAGQTTTGYRAFGSPINKNGDNTYDGGVTHYADSSVPSGNGAQSFDNAIALDNGFYFDTVTGAIVNNGQNGTSAFPFYTWTIIANNGEGGATATSPGNAGGTTARPTPAVAVHDVDSAELTLKELFSDVSTNGQFSTAIYSLGDDNVIGGFADGTFRPGISVSRQAFAHFVAETLNEDNDGGSIDTGACSTIRPSAFPDVPNSSQFCAEIRDLVTAGVINGYSDGKFHPTRAITRQAIAALLYRAYQYEETDGNPADGNSDARCTTPTGFNDVTTSNPFCGDIEFLVQKGVANGFADGGFHPAAKASRQATAQFIYKLFESEFETFQSN